MEACRRSSAQHQLLRWPLCGTLTFCEMHAGMRRGASVTVQIDTVNQGRKTGVHHVMLVRLRRRCVHIRSQQHCRCHCCACSSPLSWSAPAPAGEGRAEELTYMGELPAAAIGVVSPEWNACNMGLPQRWQQQTNSLSTACENLQHPKLHYPPHLLCQLLALLVALKRATVALQRLRKHSGTQVWQTWAGLQPAGCPAAACPAVQGS